MEQVEKPHKCPKCGGVGHFKIGFGVNPVIRSYACSGRCYICSGLGSLDTVQAIEWIIDQIDDLKSDMRLLRE